MNKELTEKIEEIVSPIIEARGLQLVDIEFKSEREGKVLRIYIDKKCGVTLKDCEDVSVMLSSVLDVHDLIPEHYILEVSSPGLYRELKKEKDFLNHINDRIKVHLYTSVEGEKVLIGKLLDYKEGKLKLLVEPTDRVVEILKENIAKVNLEPDISELLKKDR